jgi:hypothetical protein
MECADEGNVICRCADEGNVQMRSCANIQMKKMCKGVDGENGQMNL